MFYVIGLMSGTSMDGINATLVKTNGIELLRTPFNLIEDYRKETKIFLKKTIENPLIYQNSSFRKKLDKLVTEDHYKVIKNLIKLSNITPEYIGFHGQTILHNPKDKISIQAGEAKLLSNLLNLRVISSFRTEDISLGGEGAPLAPIYHKYIIENLKTKLPTCIINIGGIANVTYWDGNELIAFDTGPGNSLMDIYMQKNLRRKFDKDGKVASKGTVMLSIINEFERDKYFKKDYPKSLDVSYFKKYLNKNYFKKMSHEDVMANLLAFTVKSISIGISQLPKSVYQIIILGGGMYNDELIKKLNLEFSNSVSIAKNYNLPGDMIEAELIAYISIRRLFKLPITFPSTTGVKKKLSGGKVFDNNSALS